MSIDTKLVQFMTLNRHKSPAGNDCTNGNTAANPEKRWIFAPIDGVMSIRKIGGF